MPLLFLKRPCPWCGVPTVIPPAMPLEDLAIQLELPCAACSGGVRARSGWLPFALFATTVGAAVFVTLFAGSAWLPRALEESSSAHAGTAAAWAAAVLMVIALSASFLVSNSALQRGTPPRPRA
jgi:hypothetical protein